MPPAPARQRGIALLLVLLGIMLFSSYLLIKGIDPAYAKIDRDRVTREALEQAKQALIARAAMDPERPGALPCPDSDESGVSRNAPKADAPPGNPFNHRHPGLCGSNAQQRVGKLPWRSLRIPPLRDGSGELLWYALSANFMDVSANQINSDGPLGTLQVLGADGVVRDKYVVAVIIAPGAALPGQDRSAGAARNDVRNYLEAENNWRDPAFDNGTNNDIFTYARPEGEAFNDVVAVITREELMAAVENAVAMRLEKELRPELERYVAWWGALPFAVPAPFDPDMPFAGVAGTRSGGLPVDPPPIVWAGLPAIDPNPALSDFDQVGTDGFLNLGATSCIMVGGGTSIRCTINYSDTPSFALTLTANNVALGFASYRGEGQTVETDCMTDAADEAAYRNANFGLAQSSAVSGSDCWIVTRELLPGGQGRLVYTGRLPTGSSPYILEIPAPTQSPVLRSAAGAPLDWFFLNGWHRQAFYSISAGFVPGQSAACDPIVTGQPACLTIRRRGVDRPAAALLVMSGSRLNAEAGGIQGRRGIPTDAPWLPAPATAVPAAPAAVDVFQYLDSTQNQDIASDDLFEERPRTLRFNDRIVQLIPPRP